MIKLYSKTHWKSQIFPCVKNVRFISKDSNNNSSSSSSSSDSDVENKQKPLPNKNNETLNKLQSLLQKMIEEDAVHKKTNIKLAQPVKKLREHGSETRRVETAEKQMVKAVKDVAESIGGNTKQTESELLLKLLNPDQSEKPSSYNLSDIVKGMKIDRDSKPREQPTRADQVKQILRRPKGFSPEQQPNYTRQYAPKVTPERVIEKIDLFGGKPLGIFTDKNNLKDGIQNQTWDKMYKRDLRLAVTHPPSNYFQQMILWTEQGKVWKFPIDNEQGLEKEKQVCFSEHVFLEKHLEPWCPQKGPIRHFMELVCVGLSKNPYLTVEAKKEHIDWYKSYFDSKKDLLKAVGAIPAEIETEQQQNKQLE